MITALNVDKLRLDMGEYVLSVQGLGKRVRGREALSRVDLDVKRGVVHGARRTGRVWKTLTLACIAGASRPTRGRVRCFGYMSVLDTVTVGALLRKPHPCAARAHAREILALTGLAERAALRFELLDALDRKRLELARALATEPQLLLLDDLAAGLETPAVAALGGIFTALRGRGTTVVAATRTLEHLPLIADDVVAIDRGKTAK